MLTIAYMTNRLYPCWEWFLDSLRNQMDREPVNIVVVDFHQSTRPNVLPTYVTHVAPKPCVWQGPHRLTSRDYFAAANARNTAACYAVDGWIAYVDDLSVLLPGWLAAVRQGMREGYTVLGAYRKVLGLSVVDGKVEQYSDHPPGHDSRWAFGRDDCGVRLGTGSLFGCSLAMPVELLMTVNGWDESCDGMGYEDANMSVMLARRATDMRYDRRMLTYESEELHHIGTPFLRVDKKIEGERGPDASHAMMRAVNAGPARAENAHLGMSLRELRRRTLAGDPFPIPSEPQTHWPDNQPLREM